MATIAWFGTGLMGAGFVEALRGRGEDVVVWNRTPEKAKALERLGARAVDDPRDAARAADFVHVMVSDDEAVDALLERVLDALRPGAVIVDHTTVAPKPTAARAERLAKRGVPFAYAPVFMTPQATREGKGVMLAAAEGALFERVRPQLEPMSGHLWYVGEQPAKASALKLFGNQMLFFVTAGLADGYALGKAAGFDPAQMHELFSHFTFEANLQGRGKKMTVGDYSPAFELAMARKDARLMQETAPEGMVLLPAIAARMDALIARGYGDRDLGALGIDVVPERAEDASAGGP